MSSLYDILISRWLGSLYQCKSCANLLTMSNNRPIMMPGLAALMNLLTNKSNVSGHSNKQRESQNNSVKLFIKSKYHWILYSN